MPVMSDVRLMRAVDRAPAVALRKPGRDVARVARDGALVSVPIDVVALMRASVRAFVKYLLFPPSASASVVVPAMPAATRVSALPFVKYRLLPSAKAVVRSEEH